MKLLIKNAKILTDANATPFKGDVAIENGKITYVGKSYDKKIEFDRVIEANGNLLTSGFCNAHAHSAMTLFRGVADDLPLKEWLFDKIFPMEDHLNEEDIYWGTKLAILEYAKSGITAVADMYFYDDAIKKAFENTGLALALCSGKNDIGGGTDNALDYIEKAYLKYKDKNRLKYIIGLHAEYTCSDRLMLGVADLVAKYEAPTYIHLSETLNEVGECQVKRGLTPPEYLHKIGFFDYGGIIAHGTYLDKNDIDLLKEKNVYCASNPSSNLKLASGVAPVYTMLNRGMKVCIGTDGAASNNSLSAFKEMYLLSALQKERMKDAACVSAEETINSATSVGYEALGFNGGSIAVNKDADLVLIDLQSPNMRPLNNIKKHLVYSADTSNVLMTIAGGNIVYEKGNFFIGEDVDAIYVNAEKSIKRLIKQLGK